MSAPRWMHTSWQIVWRSGLFMLAFAGISSLLIVPVAPRLSEWGERFPAQSQLCFDFAGVAAMLAATWLMTRFIDRRPFASIGLRRGGIARQLLAGAAIGVGWLALSVGTVYLAGWADYRAPGAISVATLLVAAVSILLNVLTQQLLLCGFIFQTIASRTGFSNALIVSAILFSIYHAGAFEGAFLPAVNVFAAGALFCVAYGISDSLWLPAAAHFAWNFLLGPVLGLAVSGSGRLGLGWQLFELRGPALVTGGDFGLEGGLVVTLSTAVLVIVILVIRPGRLAGRKP